MSPPGSIATRVNIKAREADLNITLNADTALGADR
jgi:hypothetical protein